MASEVGASSVRNSRGHPGIGRTADTFDCGVIHILSFNINRERKW